MADQLELLLQLKEERDKGNPQVDDWTAHVIHRLLTDTARELARLLLERHSANWWFDRWSDWWVRDGKE